MKFLSVCSGIEAASVAWAPLGWKAWAFSEIEPFPCSLLAHHYPDTPNFGDMTKFQDWPLPDEPIDLLCGGTPCQSFSVAGLRKGLADPRGNLMLTYLAIARKYRPRWLVWENVPGVLSSNGGRDFGAFLGGLGQLGYGFAYRVLDAQYFGVAQRRRRVFVVGYLGDWRRAAAVLFERHSMQGNPAPRRETRQGVAMDAGASATDSGIARPHAGDDRGGDIAGTLSARTQGGGGLGTDFDLDGGLVAGTISAAGSRSRGAGHDTAYLTPDIVSQAMSAKWAKGTAGPAGDEHHNLIAVPDVTHALRGEDFDASEDGTGRGTPLVPIAYRTAGDGAVFEEGSATAPLTTNTDPSANIIALGAKDHGANAMSNLAPTLRAGGHADSHANAGAMPAIAFQERGRADGRNVEIGGETAYALTAPKDGGRAQERNILKPAMQVRRLTPRECERLQGFPLNREEITIYVCLDRQNNLAYAEIQCRKWLGNALLVGDAKLSQPAETAQRNSSTHQADHDPLAVFNVHMRFAGKVRQLPNPGKSIWSASNADQSNGCHQPTQHADSVLLVAEPLHFLVQQAQLGRAESLRNIRLSFPAETGNSSAQKFGDDNAACVNDAARGPKLGTYTTSHLGQVFPTCDSPIATSLCSVIRAIVGFIPNETLPENFSLEISLSSDYTAIPHRGKPAADGPRYKALGNSWAVPCARWIGERIAAVDNLDVIQDVAA